METHSSIPKINDNDHRNQFNLDAFGTTFAPGEHHVFPMTKKRRKGMTKEEYDKIVTICRYWVNEDGYTDPTTGEHVTQEQLWKSCGRQWHTKRHEYKFEPVLYGDGRTVEHLWKEIPEKHTRKLVVHQEMVFDAIRDCHNAVGHMKGSTTHARVAEIYDNISEDLCKIFIRTCPVCNSTDKMVVSAQLTSKYHHFRDRFTACIVDYSDTPVTDLNDVTMRYILAVQDDATQFTALRPISRKDEASLAYELSFMFGLLGYPRKTFTSDEKAILKSHLIRGIIDHWTTTCSHKSGETTRIKAKVKNVISNLLSFDNKDDDDSQSDSGTKSNWVRVVPDAMVEINHSSYHKVYGMVFSNSLSESVTTTSRKISTVNVADNIVSGVCQGDDNASSIPDGTGNLSGTEIANNVYSGPDVEQQQPTVAADPNSNNDVMVPFVVNNGEVVPPSLSDDDTHMNVQLENIQLSDLNQNAGPNASNETNGDNPVATTEKEREGQAAGNPPLVEVSLHNQVPADMEVNTTLEVLGDTMSHVLEFTGQCYPAVTQKLVCNKCNKLYPLGTKELLLAEDNYYDALGKDSRSWPINVVRTFAWLKVHEKHKKNQIFDDFDGRTANTNPMPIQPLPDPNATILSLALNDSHYVVLDIDPGNWKVIVYDGTTEAEEDLRKWDHHIDNVLARYGLSRNVGPHWIIRHHKFTDFRSA